MTVDSARQQSPRGAGQRAPAAQPRLSVIIVSFDCRELVEACLHSIEAQADELQLEVVVVDNASADGTAAMVRDRFPWVQLVASRENLGFARANNLAIERASGASLLLLNPDTVVPRGALVAAVSALEQRSDVGMLGCKLVRPDGSLDHACKRGFPTPLSSLYYFSGLTRLRPRSPRFAHYTSGHVDADEAALVDAVNGAFMLVRREALEAVGPMDEDYWLYMEDLDWCYRFWRAGWPVFYWPGTEVVHVKAGSTTSNRRWRANLAFHRGMWIFYRKHYAATRPWAVTAAVWIGVWAKLALSAARSFVARHRRRT
jgi:GT2 family glycosyltransferase